MTQVVMLTVNPANLLLEAMHSIINHIVTVSERLATLWLLIWQM